MELQIDREFEQKVVVDKMSATKIKWTKCPLDTPTIFSPKGSDE